MERTKMKQADRAKQFLAFDALKGFFEIVNEHNKEVEERRYLSEESLERLDYLVGTLKRGDLIEITHYEDGHYITTQGMFARLDYETRSIQVVKKKIKIDDVLSINVLLKNN